MNAKRLGRSWMFATKLFATKLFATKLFAAILTGAFAVSAAVSVAQLPASKPPTSAAGDVGQTAIATSFERVREGTKIVQASGEFQATGERIHFTSKTMPPLKVLENLALERVAQTLSERGAGREWTVSGVVTEYRGVNYLLLTRATLKTRRAD